MKNQALFSSKVKSKKLKCHLLQFLFGTSRGNMVYNLPQEITINFFSLKEINQKRVSKLFIKLKVGFCPKNEK